jgi:protein arginine N-methyltransferase 1
MVTSEPRMSVYAEALRRAVTPGCTVIDLGASFGPFAILACKYGAGKVIAIEPDPSVELVMPLAMANGCADRIEVFRGLSTHYTPVQKADVLVSDLRGSIPLYQKHIEAIADARTRLLKPGGQQLPLRDTIRVALVSSAGAYRSCVEPWLSNRYDLDLSLGQRFVVNDSMRITLDAKALMSDPHDLVSLDYPTITDPNVDSTVELVATRSATAHGLQMWFDAEIAEGLTFSNAPGEPPLVYGRRFLPFERAVRLKRGDRVTARIRAMLLDIEYIISWHCTITGGATGAVKAIFKQSTFNSKVYPQKDIETYSTAHVPAPGTALAIDRDCLALVGEGRSVAEIARALQRLYPEQLADDRAALNRVTGLLSRYDTGGQ